MNLAAVQELQDRFPELEIVFIESGGDNLSATFSPELADLMIYVIDVAEGEKIPRKGGPGITRSDFRDLYEELLEVYLENAASHIFEDISLCDMPDWVLNQVDETLQTECMFEEEAASDP